MDLIVNDKHMVSRADLHQALQLLPAPDPPDRVVGITENQDLVPGIPGHLLQAGKVHLIGIFLPDQRVVHQLTAAELRRQGKGIVDRLLDDDAIPRFGQQIDQHEDGRHHAAGGDDPLLLTLVTVAALLPPKHRVKICLRGAGVPLDHRINEFLQPLPDLRSGKKFHVRRGHGQHIRPHIGIDLPHPLPFARAAGGAVNDGGKIIAHRIFLLFYCQVI